MRRTLAFLLLAGCEAIANTPAPTLAELPDAGPGFDARPIVLTVVARGNGEGTIDSLPEGIFCPPDCQASFAPGTPITLVARPAEESRFGLWNGVTSCTGNQCTFAPQAGLTVEGSFLLPFNVMFATSTARAPGALGGRDGANAECTARARAGGYPGSFIAWLSDGTVPELGSLPGWISTDGQTLSVRGFELNALLPYVPPRLDELGQVLPGGARVVTDITLGGRSRDGDHCGGYRVESSSLVGFGDPFSTRARWTSAGTLRCDEPAHLYCLQTDTADLPPEPTLATLGPGELRAFAFFVDAVIAPRGHEPTGGRDAADAACQRVGDSIPGGRAATWIALVATTAEPAVARVPAGKIWFRLDGIRLGTSAELKAGRFEVPLNRGIRPTEYFGPGDQVWVGATSLTATAPNSNTTCGDWNTKFASALVAEVSSGRSDFDTIVDCTTRQGLWCLELP